jgi:hypothetical protein
MSPKATPVPTEEAHVAAGLADLAAKLQASADDKAKRSAVVAEAEEFLGNIPVKAFPDLAESPAIQSFVKLLGVGDLQPGEVRRPGTLAERVREWTEADLGQFEMVTFEPRETLPLTWNGITIYVQDGVECTIPKPFADIYREHRRALEQKERHENYLLGYTNQPPDPNWISEDSATVRAWSQMGPPPDPRKRGVGPFSMNDGAEAAGA